VVVVPYTRLTIKRIRELEEDAVITNQRTRARTFLRKLAYKSLLLFEKMRRRLKGSREY
jgi:hypothetical protein